MIIQKQQEALDAIHSGENIFLSGFGGTGKSWVIQQVVQQLPDTVLCAPTGIAALNIGGVTCHSLFGLPIGLPQQSDYFSIPPKMRQLFLGGGVNRIIIDEVSMLRADYFDIIDRKLKFLMGNKIPFGGIQMIVVGDFFQLPPIVSKNEEEHFFENYETAYSFSSECWNFKAVELTQAVRQEDTEQVALLGNIRKGIKVEDTLQQIMSMSSPTLEDDWLQLCSYNNDADKINNLKYRQVKGQEHTFKALYTEGFGREEPAPRLLKLKKGVKVLLTANNHEEGYVNGDKGVVKDFIDVEDKQVIIVKLDNGDVVNVTKNKWEKYTYTKKPEGLSKEVAGIYTQFPIKLGWAVSVHKSQSLTLDGVGINVGRGCFSHGQFYVALSRCKDLRKVHFIKPVRTRDVIVDDDVKEFMQALCTQ